MYKNKYPKNGEIRMMSDDKVNPSENEVPA